MLLASSLFIRTGIALACTGETWYRQKADTPPAEWYGVAWQGRDIAGDECRGNGISTRRSSFGSLAPGCSSLTPMEQGHPHKLSRVPLESIRHAAYDARWHDCALVPFSCRFPASP